MGRLKQAGPESLFYLQGHVGAAVEERISGVHNDRAISVGNGHRQYDALTSEEMDRFIERFGASGEDSLPGVVICIPVNEARVLEVAERTSMFAEIELPKEEEK